MQLIGSGFIAEDANIAIIIARVNRVINNNLLEGSVDILKRVGKVKDENIKIVWVPGSYELPLMAKVLAASHQYSALIALGTIIKGVTSHFEFLSKESNSKLLEISIQYMLPIGFGVLTTNNLNQAIERSGIKSNNKGSESALAVLEMINVLKIVKK